MDLDTTIDTTRPETIRLETQCQHSRGICEIRERPAQNNAACAIKSLQVDIHRKMRHAMDVHGLSHQDAMAFVAGCYVTANAESLARDSLVALGVLVGELASNV